MMKTPPDFLFIVVESVCDACDSQERLFCNAMNSLDTVSTVKMTPSQPFSPLYDYSFD